MAQLEGCARRERRVAHANADLRCSVAKDGSRERTNMRDCAGAPGVGAARTLADRGVPEMGRHGPMPEPEWFEVLVRQAAVPPSAETTLMSLVRRVRAWNRAALVGYPIRSAPTASRGPSWRRKPVVPGWRAKEAGSVCLGQTRITSYPIGRKTEKHAPPSARLAPWTRPPCA